MNRRNNLVAGALSLMLAAMLLGCQPPATTPPAPESDTAQMDPCAERLHDICGQLLLYYAIHKELPESLIELEKAGLGEEVPLECPVSHKPYVYNLDGVLVNNLPGLMIVYDAEPVHNGMRWGIMAEPPRPGHPLVVRVVKPQEAAIAWPQTQ